MKYIITESQINKLVFLYLDSQDWHTWDIGDGEFNVADGQYGEDVMKFRIQYSSTEPDHEFNVIYISDDLVTKMSELFSISSKNSIRAIIDWFNKKYDKNLTMDDFEWMEKSDTYYADDDEENY
jgi:hypothetical protein